MSLFSFSFLLNLYLSLVCGLGFLLNLVFSFLPFLKFKTFWSVRLFIVMMLQQFEKKRKRFIMTIYHHYSSYNSPMISTASGEIPFGPLNSFQEIIPSYQERER